MVTKALVVGSGVIGLRTSIELLRNNVKVVLRSPRPPLDASTCSMGAGGLWLPFHCDDPRTNRWSIETLNEIYPLAMQQEKYQEKNLVEIVSAISLKRNHNRPTVDNFTSKIEYPFPEWTKDKRFEFQHLSVEMLWWQNYVNLLKIPSQEELTQAGYLYAWLFKTPIVNTEPMLEYMLQQIIDAGPDSNVNVETGNEYESIEHMIEDAKLLDCDTIINCTGLGASKICNDNELIGARGILYHFDRASCTRRLSTIDNGNIDLINDACILTEEEPWGTEEMPCYMIPRGDKLVIGGSYLEGDLEPGIRSAEREKLMQNAEWLGIDTNDIKSQPISEWVGFRPYRPISRCEVENRKTNNNKNGNNNDDSMIRVVHNYGYGGSGWTVYVGAAKEATKLALQL